MCREQKCVSLLSLVFGLSSIYLEDGAWTKPIDFTSRIQVRNSMECVLRLARRRMQTQLHDILAADLAACFPPCEPMISIVLASVYLCLWGCWSKQSNTHLPGTEPTIGNCRCCDFHGSCYREKGRCWNTELINYSSRETENVLKGVVRWPLKGFASQWSNEEITSRLIIAGVNEWCKWTWDNGSLGNFYMSYTPAHEVCYFFSYPPSGAYMTSTFYFPSRSCSKKLVKAEREACDLGLL